jgi:hypothetical protein
VWILVTENIVLTKQRNNITTKRDMDDWEEIFMEDDANISVNKFLNTYLRIFHSCFFKK